MSRAEPKKTLYACVRTRVRACKTEKAPLKFWVNFGSHAPKKHKTTQYDLLRYTPQNGKKSNIIQHYKTVRYELTQSVNPQVVGSSPTRGAKKKPHRLVWFLFAFHAGYRNSKTDGYYWQKRVHKREAPQYKINNKGSPRITTWHSFLLVLCRAVASLVHLCYTISKAVILWKEFLLLS